LHGGITKKWAKGKPTTRLLMENLEAKDLIPRSLGLQEKLACSFLKRARLIPSGSIIFCWCQV